MRFIRSYFIRAILLISIIGFILCLFTRWIIRDSQNTIHNALSEISAQSCEVIQEKVNLHKSLLSNLAILFSSGTVEVDQIIEQLNAVSDENGFKYMGIITEDRVAYITDNYPCVQLTSEELSKLQAPEHLVTYISESLANLKSGENVTVYYNSFLDQSKNQYLLFGTLDNEIYRNTLSVNTFGGSGYSYIIQSNGDRVLRSNNPLSLDFQNLFDSLGAISEKNQMEIQDMKAHIQNQEKGMILCDREDASKRLIYFQPLKINDWYLLTLVPESVIYEELASVLIPTYILVISFFLLFIAIFIYIVRRRKKHEQTLSQVLFSDSVTKGSTIQKLYLDFQERFQGSSEKLAVVCYDIIGFKHINDLFGYEKGNLTLQYVYQILEESLQPDELLARFRDDQFIVCMQYTTKDELEERIQNVISKIESTQHYQNAQTIYRLTLKAGVYCRGRHEDIKIMISSALFAIQEYGQNHSSRVVYYDMSLYEKKKEQKLISDSFEKALSNQEFTLFYQPKYNLRHQCFSGAEILVRWYRDGKPWLRPDIFIPVFERSGQILKLDEFILEETCKSIRRWLDQGKHVGTLSVNISMVHLYRIDFADTFLQIIDKYQIPHSCIELELTETALVENFEHLTNALNRFRQNGILISMDDFGKGYSSIGLLQHMPVDKLKLDKSLVDHIADNEKSANIFETAIHLAHSIHLTTVAEGIETEEQVHYMERMGVDYVQGYYYAKPVSSEEYEKNYLR